MTIDRSTSDLNEGKKSKKSKAQAKPDVEISELFDIVPNNGVLEPDQTESVEISFNAICSNLNVEGLAVCEVEGGPE